ncbi:molybdopterin molybdotransferase MoeA [Brachybacterium sp. UMB0905]|uniref:molybdopterin molybdotransferase MoeA n=1 Tax=Brachybacterium sp. UMB0905 TaxID=2069310 RepID=UPI000C809471|nr:molybdopterin molybdotransferase MoeA [Brachybacterium sp. UMB0905]PMC75575.1 molybdopterin molybdenumtransferase MoeA [Brachybacterium sp. UMB0905]
MDAWTWRAELLDALTPRPRPVAPLPPRQARGLRLAADLHSPEPIPALPVAAMDGFAVHAAALLAQLPTGGEARPEQVTVPVDGDIPASTAGVRTLRPGTAARIMTGAPVPQGADAVVPVERTDARPVGPAPAQVRIDVAALEVGRHVRAAGEEVADGALLAPAGQRVGAALVGLATTLGIRSLPVREPWRVAVVVTGNELLSGEMIAADSGAVRESNSLMLAAQLDALGCAASIHRSSDDVADFRAVLKAAARDADLVVTTGGIGHGAYDVVKSALEGSSRFAHLDLKPGGPQGWGCLPSDAAPGEATPLVHLPGTPVGALAGFHLFVRPLLEGERELLRLPLRGQLPTWRGRVPHLRVLPGRLGPDGVHVVPGARLMPYGTAEVLILLERDRAPEDPVPVVDLLA